MGAVLDCSEELILSALITAVGIRFREQVETLAPLIREASTEVKFKRWHWVKDAAEGTMSYG